MDADNRISGGQTVLHFERRIDSVNDSEAMFLRIDMPGHLQHNKGDTFSEIYLSYLAQANEPLKYATTIPASAFAEDFPPDARFNYRRDQVDRPPSQFIRAYRLRNTGTGQLGPWLAGMTLDPSIVHEAWCHQRGYVCMIEEFGGGRSRPVNRSVVRSSLVTSIRSTRCTRSTTLQGLHRADRQRRPLGADAAVGGCWLAVVGWQTNRCASARRPTTNNHQPPPTHAPTCGATTSSARPRPGTASPRLLDEIALDHRTGHQRMAEQAASNPPDQLRIGMQTAQHSGHAVVVGDPIAL